jgi:hypothetical protein
MRSRMFQSAAGAWEAVGSHYFPVLGGVIIAEATKQIYAGTTASAKSKVRGYLPLPKETRRIVTDHERGFF